MADGMFLPAFQPGLPPPNTLVALACKKWVGAHEGRPIEVIAGDPVPYLRSINITPMLEERSTVITGWISINGDIPVMFDEWGVPVGEFPSAIFAWAPLPDGLKCMAQGALAEMALRRASAH